MITSDTDMGAKMIPRMLKNYAKCGIVFFIIGDV